MEALSNFVPCKKYLRQNEQTALGLNIKSECILDSKCVAVPLSNHDQGQPLPADCARIAIMVVDHKDQCLGSLTLTGTCFREQLIKNVPVAPQPNADCVTCTSLTEESVIELSLS